MFGTALRHDLKVPVHKEYHMSVMLGHDLLGHTLPPQGTRKGQYISRKLRTAHPQGTRKGHPYHGRRDGFVSAFVHGRGAPCGYPGVGQMGVSAPMVVNPAPKS